MQRGYTAAGGLQEGQQEADTGQPATHAGAAAAIFALHCLHELQPAPRAGSCAGGKRRVRAYLPLPALRAAVALLAELKDVGPPAAAQGERRPCILSRSKSGGLLWLMCYGTS
jgi:hypothetical protein